MTSPKATGARLYVVRTRVGFAEKLLVGYAGAFGIAEWLPRVSVPAAAIALAVLAGVICVIAILPHGDAIKAVALPPTLVAIAVSQLLVVAAPTGDITPAYRLGLLAVPSGAALIAAVWSTPAASRSLRPFGPGTKPLVQLGVCAAGVPLGFLLPYAVPATMPAAGRVSDWVVCLMAIIAVVPDELLYRGLLVPAATATAGRAGLAIAVAIDAARFVAFDSAGVLVTAIAVSAALSWLRWRTGSVVGVLGARIVAVTLACLLGSP